MILEKGSLLSLISGSWNTCVLGMSLNKQPFYRPAIGQSLPSWATFGKAWKQRQEEERKSSFLWDHLNYIILWGLLRNFAPVKPKRKKNRISVIEAIVCNLCVFVYVYFQYLAFSCGVVRGALSNLGLDSVVTAEVSVMPSCKYYQNTNPWFFYLFLLSLF